MQVPLEIAFRDVDKTEDLERVSLQRGLRNRITYRMATEKSLNCENEIQRSI